MTAACAGNMSVADQTSMFVNFATIFHRTYDASCTSSMFGQSDMMS